MYLTEALVQSAYQNDIQLNSLRNDGNNVIANVFVNGVVHIGKAPVLPQVDENLQSFEGECKGVFTRRDDRLVEMIGRSADPRVRAASLSVMSAVFSRNFPSTGYRVGCVTTMVDKADIYGCRRFKRHIAGRPEFVDRTHDVGNIKEVLDLTRPAAFDSCWMYTGMLDDLSENKAPLAFCSRDGRWPLEVLKHYVGVYATGIGGEKVVFELREGALAEFV